MVGGRLVGDFVRVAQHKEQPVEHKHGSYVPNFARFLGTAKNS